MPADAATSGKKNEPHVIEIDLARYVPDAEPVSGHRLFQQEAMARIKELLQRFLKDAEEWKDDQPVHNTITISGMRGSGKTTFLVSLVRMLKNPGAEGAEAGMPGEIVPLPVLDPTLIENKDNIVLTVLACIHDLCRQKRDRCRCDSGDRHDSRDDGRDDDKKFGKVEDALRELSPGLALLDGVGKDAYYDESWSNTEHVLRSGMRQAHNGVLLRRQIYRFIDAALGYLGKKAFMLAFDDIDTRFDRGWPVLEAIRKYFTTPRLIVLLSGDMALYSKLVRRTQFENLGETLLGHDRPSRSFHRELPRWKDDSMVQMVDHLEEQYLMKVLKPGNRLSLRSLGQIYRQQDNSYQLQVKGRGALKEVLEDIIGNGFYARNEASLYIEAILDQPVRTVLQFLGAASRSGLLKDNPDRDAFARRLTDVFSAALYQSGLDPQVISDATPHGLIDQLVTWFSQAGVWDTGYRLKPEYTDSFRNQVAMVLGSSYSCEVNRSLAGALEYMLKVAWTHEHVIDLPVGRIVPWEITPEQVVSYLGLRQIEKTSTITRRSAAVQRSRNSGWTASRALLRGVLAISRAKFTEASSALQALYVGKETRAGKTQEDKETLKKKYRYMLTEWSDSTDDSAKDRNGILFWWSKVQKIYRTACDGKVKNFPYLYYTFNTVESLSSICGDTTKYLRIAAFSVPDGDKQKSWVSLFTLLGSVAELVACSDTRDGFLQCINRLSQLRTYPAPPWSLTKMSQEATAARGNSRNNAKDNEDEEDSEENEEDNTSLADSDAGTEGLSFDQYVLTWAQRARKYEGIGYSTAFYGRVFSRFYYALGNMDDEFTARDIYVGAVLHRQIIAFLHAVLVEEMQENGQGRPAVDRGKVREIPPKLDNPICSDALFLENLPFAVKEQENKSAEIDYSCLEFTGLPLFELLFSCPLFALFVSPKSERISGGKAMPFELLEMLVKSWKDPEENEGQTGEEAIEARREALQVTCTFPVKETVTFPNMWAPLHSLMIPGKGPLAKSIMTSPGGKGKKALEETPPDSTTPEDDAGGK